MDIENSIKTALDGDSVLFLGAGFSLGAVALTGHDMRPAQKLATYLSAMAQTTDDETLEDAAESFIEEVGVDELIRELQREFTAKKVADWHKTVAKLPWKRIYTTNYDTVIERAYESVGRILRPVTLSDRLPDIPKDETLCVHLNGYVPQLTRAKLQTELKLTETSYVTAAIAESEWASLLRQDLRLARNVTFLGYSLYDLDIKRILLQSDPLREKSTFILGPSPGGSTERRAARYGTGHKITVEEYAKQVFELRKTYSPPQAAEFRPSALVKFETAAAKAAARDNEFRDLLMFGYCDGALITHSAQEGSRYICHRKAAEEVQEQLTSPGRIVILRSDLGNGKTLCLELVKTNLLEAGYSVYGLELSTPDIERELAQLAELKGKVVLLVDDYPNYMEELRTYLTLAGPRARAVLCARTAVHDTFSDDLVELTAKAGLDEPAEFALDKLSDESIDWFNEAFKEFGLWGTRAGEPASKKKRFLRNDCKSEIHAILLRLFESPDIAKRIDGIVATIKSGQPKHDLLVTVLAMNVLNIRPGVDVIADLLGTSVVNSPAIRKDPIVREFVDFGRDQIRARSPIIAKYILGSLVDSNSMLRLLRIVANRAHQHGKISKQYRRIFRTIMKFGSLQLILPDANKGATAIRFYESVRKLQDCKDNPLFWLQYAIAALFINDRRRANTYFETSYSLAESKGWDTFQIDNHYSRLLLEQAVADLEADAAIENFRDAKRILHRQMEDEKRHYPYRVARKYQDFWDRFQHELSVPERSEVVEAARYVSRRISELPTDRANHRYVRDAGKVMDYIVRQA